MLYEFGGFALKDKFAPVWQREANPGLALGSLGAFLVIESRAHAEARGAKRIARLSAVLSDRCRRKPGDVTAGLKRLWDKISGRLQPGKVAVISGASGAAPATAEERAFPRRAQGHCRPRHRHLSRPWLRAAVSDERGARRDRGQPW